MIKNIFFDFNGTLLDDLQLCVDVEASISKEYGIPLVDKEFYLDNTAPTNTAPTASATTNSVTVNFAQTDANSGIYKWSRQYSIKKTSDTTWG